MEAHNRALAIFSPIKGAGAEKSDLHSIII
jgi:hypothetical protein